MNQYRQGDVFIEEIENIPPFINRKASIKGGNDVILAYGEVTGHAHRIGNLGDLEFYNDPKSKHTSYLRILPGIRDFASLRHEEHRTIDLPPGSYIVRRQREYQPGEVTRLVQD